VALARALRVPLLVFHDREDAIVPWADGAAISAAWTGAELVTTMGLGHRGIVHAPPIIARAVTFLTGSFEARSAERLGRPAEHQSIEDHLWQRDTRLRLSA
jgi:hypothetical protein